MKKIIAILLSVFLAFSVFASESLFETTIKESCDIYELPYSSSKVVGTIEEGSEVWVSAFSDKKETINGVNGYWVNIGFLDPSFGYINTEDKWVFAPYVNIDENINVSKILPPLKKSYYVPSNLTLKINRNGNEEEIVVHPIKYDGQSFYTFTWSHEDRGYHYTDPMGIFIYDLLENKIIHICDKGSSVESEWCCVTNDFSYLFQDIGTSPGVRNLHIVDLRENKIIFKGGYLSPFRFYDNKVEIVEEYKGKNSSKETNKNCEAFMKTLSKEVLENSLVVARYSFDLSSKEKTFIDCTTVTNQ